MSSYEAFCKAGITNRFAQTCMDRVKIPAAARDRGFIGTREEKLHRDKYWTDEYRCRNPLAMPHNTLTSEEEHIQWKISN